MNTILIVAQTEISGGEKVNWKYITKESQKKKYKFENHVQILMRKNVCY